MTDSQRLTLSTAALVVVTVLSGCASTPSTPTDVIIDHKGVNSRQYALDLDECASYADQVHRGEKVANSATAGAVVGAAIGSVYRNGSTRRGAAAGAVTGAVQGVVQGNRERRTVMRNCLRNRGYVVLN